MSPEYNKHSKEWSFEDYLDLALRRRWLILITFVIVFGVAVYYSLSRPPQFASAITFSIDTQTEQAGLGNRTMMPYYYYRMGLGKNLEYYQALIQSAPFHNRVVQDALQDTELLANGGLTHEEIIKAISSGLSLSKEEMSNLMYMSVRAGDPVTAYRMAIIAGDAFKDRAREIEQEQSKNVVEYVSSQVEEAERNLELAERQLQAFKSRTGFVVTENNDGIIQQLNNIENHITEIQTERQLAEYNIQTFSHRLQQMQNDDASSLLDDESPKVVALRQTLDSLEKQKYQAQEAGETAKIAGLDKDINSTKEQIRKAFLDTQSQESDRMLSSIDNPYEALREQKIAAELRLYSLQNEEKYYLQLAENFRQQHPNILEHAIEYSKLRRSRAVAEELYSYLVKQGEEANIKAQTGTGGVLVVSPPRLPEKPIPSKAPRNIFIGFVMGLALGFGFAFVLDYFDRTLHTPEDVERHLDITVIGAIPHIDNAKMKENSAPHAATNPVMPVNGNAQHVTRLIPQMNSKSPLVEAYRNLRTDLQFVNVDEPISQLLISSSMPGEGKSLTTANLAISYAELGKRVLIVDCDMRKPMQYKIFAVEKMPGLSDCLIQSEVALTAERVIQPTVIKNLFILPSGTNPPNPAEMLASHKMDLLIENLRDKFDIILYDTPPIMAVSDPKILVPKVKNALLVIRASKASYAAIEDAIDRLRKVGGNVVGAILNGVGTTKGYGYYYKYSYYYNYSYYYDETGTRKHKKEKIDKNEHDRVSA